MDGRAWVTGFLSFAVGCGAGLLACFAGVIMLIEGESLGCCLLLGLPVLVVGEAYLLPAVVLMYGGFACFLTHGRYPTSRLARVAVILVLQVSCAVLNYVL
jgi:hypothetical protein